MDVKSQLKDAQFEHSTNANLASLTPRVGRVVYVTDLKKVVFGDGSNWLTLKGSPFIVVGTPTDVSEGKADYSTITDGITNAVAGDKIVILAGTFNESFNVTKQVTIEGAGRGVIINGNIDIQEDGVMLSSVYINGQLSIEASTANVIATNFWVSQGTTVVDNNIATESSMFLYIREA